MHLFLGSEASCAYFWLIFKIMNKSGKYIISGMILITAKCQNLE